MKNCLVSFMQGPQSSRATRRSKAADDAKQRQRAQTPRREHKSMKTQPVEQGGALGLKRGNSACNLTSGSSPTRGAKAAAEEPKASPASQTPKPTPPRVTYKALKKAALAFQGRTRDQELEEQMPNTLTALRKFQESSAMKDQALALYISAKVSRVLALSVPATEHGMATLCSPPGC